MSSMCRNYVNCLRSLEQQNDHHGLCIECFVACQEFIADIQLQLSGHKLSIEDGIYLFLHRNNTLEDLARHLGTYKIADYLPTSGTLTIDLKHLQPVQTALLCLHFRDTITAEQLIELAVERDEDVKEEEDINLDESVRPNTIITEKIIPEKIVLHQTAPLQPEMAEKPVSPTLAVKSDHKNTQKALRLIVDIIGDRKLPKNCVDFTSAHLKGCKAAELDTLMEMTTCRHLASHGVIKNCFKAPPERTGRGNHREVWMVPVESIILSCDKHFNWIAIKQAVKQLKEIYPDIVIDRNTLRRYILDENLCPYDKDLYGELAILVSVLPGVPSRYKEIQTRLLKNRGIHKDAPKPNELTPDQIFVLLDKKIPYKTVLNYLGKKIIPGTKRHGHWISTTDQYKEFLQRATNGVRGMRPEHIPICREYLSKVNLTKKAEH